DRSVAHRSFISFPTRRSSDLKGIALQKVCSTSRNSLDSIVISMFLGLNMIAIYSNYYYIMISIHNILYQIPDSIRATVGNSVARSEEHTSELQSRFDLVCRLL